MTVLFIGFGSIAQKHKKALLRLYPDAAIYALRSKKDAPSIPGVNNTYEWSALPARIDFAVIATPTFLHLESLNILIEKKIPVLLEKPIADSLNGLDQLSKKIIAENAFVYIACNLRFLPVLQFLKKLIEENNPVINEVNIYCGSFLPSWRPDIDFRKNYSANIEMGGGVYLDLFHELDYTCWIFGLPQQSKVLKRNVSSLEINAADYAMYLWEYKKFTAAITLNYYRPVAKRNIEIVFEGDIWNANILTNEIKNSKNEIVFSNEEYTIEDTYFQQMKYVTDCLQNNRQPLLNTFSSSLEILKLCLS
jgi:predicted dehydrogenase